MMENQREVYEALLAGETLISSTTSIKAMLGADALLND